ncbi:N-acetylphosphatidylethanolamine-hydrolyzing phospholipase D NDAI_0E02620 [Naumovozyma dairenensis CBS 421]|uniref:Metallo-beta-lactamase domain-containing protein n=1 Tax=Naumovozyma dairenensis (strain ATCC 10597 / BCRC 20456 / CBS 421 / NBRC 0211 / NRRL Y-12639) TaxID=1071378 RepID=G0WBF9_NAUDC|nr:hypothetical protein NDAI_0E02620 [Naumovozyma dairenensis CBS 421]CCD25079.1 hypothetical protein NDAI_0E02620 [Naumovozyma dairenensis CBS 421]
MRLCSVGMRRIIPSYKGSRILRECSSKGFTRFYSYNFQGTIKKTKIPPKQKRRYILGTFLTFLFPYTGYALYVTISTAKEIEERYRDSQLVEAYDKENKEKGNFKSTLIKYSPLQVLGRYENPFVEYRIQTIYEFFFNRFVEIFEVNRGGLPPTKEQMDQLMPIHKPDWCKRQVDPPPSRVSPKKLIKHKIVDDPLSFETSPSAEESNVNIPIYNTWLGQSCNFTTYNGLKILTDPIFSDFLIHEKLGPKRITFRPCEISDVPTPDIILVSHNHPDHLDPKSLEYWKDANTLWIIPKGMKPFMDKHKVQNVIEISWWQSVQLTKNNENYFISSTPAMHWSGRSILDTNQSLWCSFLLSHKGKPILFHAGDTGYVKDLYQRIKNRFGGGCKLALLPCGQYCPEWHQKPRHINSKEVIDIMQDLEIKNVLGVHWGTFLLSGEYFLEPKQKLEMLAEWKGIKDHCFCPELGKTIKFE